MRQETKDRAYCRQCIYYGSEEYGNNLCDFMLRTGKQRGCRYGEGCEKRIMREKRDGNARAGIEARAGTLLREGNRPEGVGANTALREGTRPEGVGANTD